MPTSWSDIPRELVEQILSRVPVQLKCHSRLVCKSWNKLISTLPATSSAQILLGPHALKSHRPSEVLDIAGNHVYKLSDQFVQAYLMRTTPDLPSTKFTLAADKGLLLVMYYFNQDQTRRHLVCNPVTREIEDIPAPQNFHFQVHYGQDIFVMRVDHPSQTYQIVIIRLLYALEEVIVYESARRQWRHLCRVPRDVRLSVQAPSCGGITGRQLVVLSYLRQPWYPNLYLCDLVTGACTHMPPGLLRTLHPHTKMQLVVSLERLFIVEFCRLVPSHCNSWEKVFLERRKSRVVIYEILLARQEVAEVAEMPSSSSFHPVVATAL